MGLDMYLYALKPIDSRVIPTRFLAEAAQDGYAYISAWDHSKDDEARELAHTIANSHIGVPLCSGSPHVDLNSEDGKLTVQACVAYWRKANAVHAWFVDNVQDGVDECQPAPVTRDQLAELRDAAQKVIDATELHDGLICNGHTLEAGSTEWRPNLEEGKMVVDSSAAEELLPTQSGFFFGSTDYDEWYMRDLKDTVVQIDRALKAPEGTEFIYQSSW